MVGGGPETIELTLSELRKENSVPLIVVGGSGKAADVLVFAYRLVPYRNFENMLVGFPFLKAFWGILSNKSFVSAVYMNCLFLSRKDGLLSLFRPNVFGNSHRCGWNLLSVKAAIFVSQKAGLVKLYVNLKSKQLDFTYYLC